MKAVAKLFRKLDDGTLRPVEAFLSSSSQLELLQEEERQAAVVRFYHGNCLESELVVSFIGEGRVIISLALVKKLVKDAPPEAVCDS